MTTRDPRRLVGERGVTGFERGLLDAARNERPPAEMKQRMARALGLSGAAALSAGLSGTLPSALHPGTAGALNAEAVAMRAGTRLAEGSARTMGTAVPGGKVAGKVAGVGKGAAARLIAGIKGATLAGVSAGVLVGVLGGLLGLRLLGDRRPNAPAPGTAARIEARHAVGEGLAPAEAPVPAEAPEPVVGATSASTSLPVSAPPSSASASAMPGAPSRDPASQVPGQAPGYAPTYVPTYVPSHVKRPLGATASSASEQRRPGLRGMSDPRLKAKPETKHDSPRAGQGGWGWSSSSHQDATPAVPTAAATMPADLRAEIDLIDAARNALHARSPARALGVLNRYDARFPRGALAPEAVALRVEALVQSDQPREARALARLFLAANPASPLAERIRALARGGVIP